MDTLQNILLKAGHDLATCSKTPHLDVEILLCYILHKDRAFLFAHGNDHLSPHDQSLFQTLIRKRIKGVPVAYLTSKKEFYGLDFFVTRDVLIPRPETELLVERALLNIKQFINNKSRKDTRIEVLDMGTGSGCVAAAIAANTNQQTCHVTAVDVSRKALNIASKNIKKLGLQKKITLIRSNLFQHLRDVPFDLVVANLPYIKRSEYYKLTPEIFYEPKNALIAGNDGVKQYKNLFSQLGKMRLKPSHILLEIDNHIYQSLVTTLQQNHYFSYQSLKKYNDLHRCPRVLEISL